LITVETAFVVRTFFFVIFGLTISLSSIFQFNVFLTSIILLGVLYGVRFLVLKLFLRTDIIPELFIAPRGLITVLLFFAIPTEYQYQNFESGILLFLIIASSIIMAIALIKHSKKPKLEINEDDQFDIGKLETQTKEFIDYE
jgi:NhaP-type Na+/H+ or K+/H+ antiporter